MGHPTRALADVMGDAGRVVSQGFLDPRTGADLLAQLGFLLVPGGRPRAPAYLFVAIRRRPTREHYDPEAVDFWRTEGGRGLPDELTFRSPMPLATDYSWGTIRLVDRVNASNEYLSFGGTVTGERVAGAVILVFSSPAPLLMRGGHSQGWDLGAHAAAAFFGRLRAAVGRTAQVEAATAEATPVVRYAAFVADALTRYSASEMLRAINGPFWRWLSREARRLRHESAAEWQAGERLLAEARLDRPQSRARR